MRTTLIILALCLSACELQLNLGLPDIDVPIPCLLPPEHCAMSDAEFSQMFDGMSDAEQFAYVEEWGRPEPQTGVVARTP